MLTGFIDKRPGLAVKRRVYVGHNQLRRSRQFGRPGSFRGCAVSPLTGAFLFGVNAKSLVD
jgi:hypothetical protein